MSDPRAMAQEEIREVRRRITRLSDDGIDLVLRKANDPGNSRSPNTLLICRLLCRRRVAPPPLSRLCWERTSARPGATLFGTHQL